MKLAAKSPGAAPRSIIRASRKWAEWSLNIRGHVWEAAPISENGPFEGALEAFRTAIEVLPQAAWLGLSISSQQEWLKKEEPENLGCMAASCAIRLGRFEEAVELLDMARSVFWKQSSSVRSKLQDLKAKKPRSCARAEASRTR